MRVSPGLTKQEHQPLLRSVEIDGTHRRSGYFNATRFVHSRCKCRRNVSYACHFIPSLFWQFENWRRQRHEDSEIVCGRSCAAGRYCARGCAIEFDGRHWRLVSRRRHQQLDRSAPAARRRAPAAARARLRPSAPAARRLAAAPSVLVGRHGRLLRRFGLCGSGSASTLGTGGTSAGGGMSSSSGSAPAAPPRARAPTPIDGRHRRNVSGRRQERLDGGSRRLLGRSAGDSGMEGHGHNKDG